MRRSNCQFLPAVVIQHHSRYSLLHLQWFHFNLSRCSLIAQNPNAKQFLLSMFVLIHMHRVDKTQKIVSKALGFYVQNEQLAEVNFNHCKDCYSSMSKFKATIYIFSKFFSLYQRFSTLKFFLFYAF